MKKVSPVKCTAPVFKKGQPDDSHKFQPLPAPSGSYPYHLSLLDIVPHASHQKMVFHIVGDTGSVGRMDFQQGVAHEMARQYSHKKSHDDQPKFLYHLGDIVYNYGEAEYYKQQFFEPYSVYPGTIFAIAGNHDSDINPSIPVPYQSLDAFTTVFCDTQRRKIVFSGDQDRESMVQPHIYWTLETPLARIIGLHSNVPKFGTITPEQRSWFVEELEAASMQRPGQALIVCLHHAPYSADTNHGSSQPMIEFLESVFEETGIKPDIVFSGHVHNYQRFSKQYADGKIVPYIVAGAGGFDELHSLAFTDDRNFNSKSPLFRDVQLEAYCDHQHGFLKIAIEKSAQGLFLTGKYYTIAAKMQSDGASAVTLTDHFIINIP
jgi:predicted phosphodiesterase